jgi:outer membrane protein assembly factor BamB
MKKFEMTQTSLWFAVVLQLLHSTVLAQSKDWTHFRGSHLDALAPDQKTPTVWSESTNVVWKTDIRGKGWSSPVIYGEQIWLTTATADGKEMAAICVDFKSGKILFDLPIFRQDEIYKKHSVNSYATPTPCLDQGFVYLHFGSSGTACLDTGDGRLIWQRRDLTCEHVQGPGSSPILYRQMLILHYEGSDRQFIVALDKTTGKTIWQTERPHALYDQLAPIGKKAYITPIVLHVNGRDLLISNGAAVCIAYDVQTGIEVWRVVQGEDSTIAMPIAEKGLIYFYTSFVTPELADKYAELLAVDPSGSGDITRSHVLWRVKSPILQLLTPLIKDGIIYTVDTKNMLMALDARTGSTIYSKKMRDKYHSSPIYADGHVYFTSEKGATTVLKAGKELQIVAENALPGEVFATPAAAGNSLIIRNESSLYRISSVQTD